MKERLKFDNSKTIDEFIRKARICYQQNRQKGDMGKRWDDKKGFKFTPTNKGNKATINKGCYKGKENMNMNRNHPRFKLPSESKKNE